MMTMKREPKLRFPEFSGEWEEKKLGEVGDIKKGEQLNKNLLKPNGKYYALNGGVEPSGYTDKYNSLANTISISEGGNSCGYVNFNKENFWSGGHCYTLENLTNSVSVTFLFQSLKHNQEKIMNLRVGTGLPNIQKTALSKFQIQIPHCAEQQKIADCLTTMDDSIEAQQQKVEQLKAYKKGLLQQIFSQSLRFPGFEGEWEKIKLEMIFNETVKKTTVNNQYDVISSTNNGLFLQRDYFNHEVASKNNIGYKVLKLNQVVLSPQNLWLGNINLNKNFEIGMVSPSYKIFDINQNFNTLFISYLIRTRKMFFEYKLASEQGASVVRRNLNMDLFKNILTKAPSIPEQQKIADCLSTLDELIELESKKLEQLRHYKKGLLQQLFV